MSIKIIKAGVQTTLQDGGRTGHRSIGIGSGGAMDSFALMMANYLTGNEETAAVIEINFPAPEIIPVRIYFISIYYICTRKGIKIVIGNLSAFIKYQRKKHTA